MEATPAFQGKKRCWCLRLKYLRDMSKTDCEASIMCQFSTGLNTLQLCLWPDTGYQPINRPTAERRFNDGQHWLLKCMLCHQAVCTTSMNESRFKCTSDVSIYLHWQCSVPIQEALWPLCSEGKSKRWGEWYHLFGFSLMPRYTININTCHFYYWKWLMCYYASWFIGLLLRKCSLSLP